LCEWRMPVIQHAWDVFSSTLLAVNRGEEGEEVGGEEGGGRGRSEVKPAQLQLGGGGGGREGEGAWRNMRRRVVAAEGG
jgi:hypothetical protein